MKDLIESDIQYKMFMDASGTREIWQAFFAFKSIGVIGKHQADTIEEIGEPWCYMATGETKQEALSGLLRQMGNALKELQGGEHEK